VLTRADVQAESAYNDALEGVVAKLDAAGLLTESDGASVYSSMSSAVRTVRRCP
jgi:hypothetical protein